MKLFGWLKRCDHLYELKSSGDYDRVYYTKYLDGHKREDSRIPVTIESYVCSKCLKTKEVEIRR